MFSPCYYGLTIKQVAVRLKRTEGWLNSLLNLVMLTALNRMHEFAVHVRGAVNNGCSRDQIREALLQAAVYCGAPAALESFRVAERVLEEIDVNG